MKAENLVIHGKYSMPIVAKSGEDLLKHLSTFQKLLIKYMDYERYVTDTSNLFSSSFFTIVFMRSAYEYPVPFWLKFKSIFKDSKAEIQKSKYFLNLNQTRDDYPFKVEFRFSYEENGYIIAVLAMPAVYFKINQTGYKPFLNDFQYSNVILTNKEFIRSVMVAIGAKEIEEPDAISTVAITSISDKLEFFGYPKIKNLLENGISKTNRGFQEDGLTDLRAALEQIIIEMVKKIGAVPKNKIFENLNILKQNGYIDENLYSIIHNTLYEWIYRYLSNTAIHKRDKISIDDAKLLFSMSEIIISYLIEKVVNRR